MDNISLCYSPITYFNYNPFVHTSTCWDYNWEVFCDCCGEILRTNGYKVIDYNFSNNRKLFRIFKMFKNLIFRQHSLLSALILFWEMPFGRVNVSVFLKNGYSTFSILDDYCLLSAVASGEAMQSIYKLMFVLNLPVTCMDLLLLLHNRKQLNLWVFKTS